MKRRIAVWVDIDGVSNDEFDRIRQDLEDEAWDYVESLGLRYPKAMVQANEQVLLGP